MGMEVHVLSPAACVFYSIQKSNPRNLTCRMFLVYNEENGKFTTGKNYPQLVLVNLLAVDQFHVKLEAIGFKSLVFEVPYKKNANNVDCSMWWDEPMKCIDCGDAAAYWISMLVDSLIPKCPFINSLHNFAGF